MPVIPQIIKSVSAACVRSRLHLEEQKKGKVQKEIDSKMQKMINELQLIKENSQGMQDLTREFDIKIVNLAKKAKENNEIKFLIEGNPSKGKSDGKGAHLEILKKRKEELLSEIKMFS